MAWWTFWRREGKAADISPLTWEALAGPGSAGITITEARALEVTAVLACARVLSEGIAQLPLKLYRETSPGVRQIATDHSLHWLLYRRPNDWQTSFEFREALMLHAAICGQGRALIVRNRQRQVQELIPLLPHRVSVEQDVDWKLTYTVLDNQGGTIGTFGRESIFEVRGPSWDGFSGMKIAVEQARNAIGLAASAENDQSKGFKAGVRPIVLSTDQALTEQIIKRIKDQWQAAWRSVGDYKTAILDAGLKPFPLDMSALDRQVVDTRRFQIEEICRAMRVFPLMVMQADKTSTFASAEQFFLAHVIHSLGPWIERWEQAIIRDLLSRDEAQNGLFPKLTVMGLLRGDARSRAEFYKSLSGLAAMSPNEIRELEDMNHYDGGDEYRVPLNTAPVGSDAASGDQPEAPAA